MIESVSKFMKWNLLEYLKFVIVLIKLNVFIYSKNKNGLYKIIELISKRFSQISPFKYYIYYKLFQVNLLLERLDLALVYLLRYMKISSNRFVFRSNYSNLEFLFRHFYRDTFEKNKLDSLFIKNHFNLSELLKDLFDLVSSEEFIPPKISDKYVRKNQKSEIDVSFIISSFNSGSKLDHFLDNLYSNVNLKSDKYELISIDSASTTFDFTRVKNWLELNKINGLVLRTSSKITVQSAWNLGIQHSVGKYLIFLGDDETVAPGAVERMVKYLNVNSDVDWLMGQSRAYNITPDNNVEDLVLSYKRVISSNLLAFLDTSQVTWVGGIYRRTLHEKFGLFNSSFTAAGDTLFKNKILPHISYEIVSDLCGIYYLYPSARLTETPRAEIEDVIAVDYFRSYTYIKLFLEKVSLAEIQELLKVSLSFKRSFFDHLSCDLQIASYILRFMVQEKKLIQFQILETNLNKLLKINLDLLTLSSINPITYLRLKLQYQIVLGHLNIILNSHGFESLSNKNEYHHEYAWGIWK